MALSSTPQNFKQRVFTCLTKLSDRDTYSLAASELESIARNLSSNSFQSFLSCINSTDASDKSPVRKHCVYLLAILSEIHGNTLSPHLSKILSNITRRLRDPDSSVRSACVNSVAALASHVTKPPFSAFLKPLADALFTEQDANSQIAAALCLASATDAAPDPEPVKLGKLLPRFEKLLKCESFKAKPALLTLIGSVIGSGGASGDGALRTLVPCLVGFLSSEDWAARKSATEALAKLAVVERGLLAEFKANCLKTFENRRFDKVKVVREAMNQMLEAWKQIPDVPDEASPLPYMQSSSKEDASDGRYPTGSNNTSIPPLDAHQVRKKPFQSTRSTPPDNSLTTTARKRSPLGSSDKRTGPSILRKMDRKKPLDRKVEISVSNCPSSTITVEGELKERDENIPDRRTNERTRNSKPDIKRALFNKNSDERKFGGFMSGSRVAPCHDESPESTVLSNVTENLHLNHKDSDDLSLIRNQLVQIEKQQTSLLDLLQRFMGSSQNGIQSLETRVHGLEMALDEISYDLAISSGRMTKTSSPGPTCCLLPGADFLSSKFWRRTGRRYSTPRFSTSTATPSVAAMRYGADRISNSVMLNHRFRLQGSGGFIVNPLAEIQGGSRGISTVPHN